MNLKGDNCRVSMYTYVSVLLGALDTVYATGGGVALLTWRDVARWTGLMLRFWLTFLVRSYSRSAQAPARTSPNKGLPRRKTVQALHAFLRRI